MHIYALNPLKNAGGENALKNLSDAEGCGP